MASHDQHLRFEDRRKIAKWLEGKMPVPVGIATLVVLAGTAGITPTDRMIGLALSIFVHAAIMVRAAAHKRELGQAAK